MRIKFIGHSALIVRTESVGVLCDPWLSGRVFNNGWGLSPEPQFSAADLASVQYLYISHEHPDHLHFPSLSAFPQEFKAGVTILFQRNNSQKVATALTKLGYRSFVTAEHNTLMPLGSGGDLFAIYQHRHLDSALIVKDARGRQIINENDAELTRADCTILRRKFGRFDVLFKQFSLAGFDGIADHAAAEGGKIVHAMFEHHRQLAADVTCPIASFMYFCRPDNCHLNQYANNVLDVQRAFDAGGLACHLMYPGAERSIEEIKTTRGDVATFERFYRDRDDRIDPLEAPTALADIRAAFAKTVAAWHEKFPAVLVNRIGAITVRCCDLEQSYDLDFRTGEVRPSGSTPLLSIHSQPLLFAFSTPFGVQTLGVSGRYSLARPSFEWKLVRVLSSLFNAEIYLRPRYLLSGPMLKWLFARRAGLFATARQQIERFSR